MAAEAEDKPFVLIVNLNYKTIEDRDEALAAWQPLATHARTSEPGTMLYEACIDDSDPLHVMVIERYASQDALKVGHEGSALFEPFINKYVAPNSEWVMEKGVEVSLQTFTESGRGFLSK